MSNDKAIEQSIVDRIKALGAVEAAGEVVTAVIKDTLSVLATLMQSDEYCWCQTFPCECVMELFDDLTDCLETRYPELEAERLAAQNKLGSERET